MSIFVEERWQLKLKKKKRWQVNRCFSKFTILYFFQTCWWEYFVWLDIINKISRILIKWGGLLTDFPSVMSQWTIMVKRIGAKEYSQKQALKKNWHAKFPAITSIIFINIILNQSPISMLKYLLYSTLFPLNTTQTYWSLPSNLFKSCTL